MTNRTGFGSFELEPGEAQLGEGTRAQLQRNMADDQKIQGRVSDVAQSGYHHRFNGVHAVFRLVEGDARR
jgi:hypothetical protein